ncbi:SMC-Scp complex subunit ScpB [Kangiella koreensis]|uniref:Chromosome segregation and condensation protein, ScpB n=1 Tax=Kangiella koreensis (strain DSM 16069 / JCM 12317 / KCTC 12182 / SW-125) TaxID=523791 RepID=C7RAK8_KANKD|nr:SMC-Scp complex subunit ScpB [Kangiella koreensis]ACV26300.1 chromosome segregation and condensation protein, ScpB [Kangiella koreensis DSM 16069]
MNQEKIVRIIEASLLAAGSTLSKDRILELFAEDENIKPEQIKTALEQLKQEAEGRGIELVEVASGFRYQARQDYAEWIARLWEERPARYSRALLETLSLIAYRQPTTRSDIEQVRGVSVSSSIVKTLLEREWIRVVGHRDVPGKPALYATTKGFLDYFNLKSLDELPSLSELQDLDNLNPEFKFDGDDESEKASEHANATEGLDDSSSESDIDEPDASAPESAEPETVGHETIDPETIDPDSGEEGYEGIEQADESLDYDKHPEGIETLEEDQTDFDGTELDSTEFEDNHNDDFEDESSDTDSEQKASYPIH